MRLLRRCIVSLFRKSLLEGGLIKLTTRTLDAVEEDCSEKNAHRKLKKRHTLDGGEILKE